MITSARKYLAMGIGLSFLPSLFNWGVETVAMSHGCTLGDGFKTPSYPCEVWGVDAGALFDWLSGATLLLYLVQIPIIIGWAVIEVLVILFKWGRGLFNAKT